MKLVLWFAPLVFLVMSIGLGAVGVNAASDTVGRVYCADAAQCKLLSFHLRRGEADAARKTGRELRVAGCCVSRAHEQIGRYKKLNAAHDALRHARHVTRGKYKQDDAKGQVSKIFCYPMEMASKEGVRERNQVVEVQLE